jgi:hypothetical protein
VRYPTLTQLWLILLGVDAGVLAWDFIIPVTWNWVYALGGANVGFVLGALTFRLTVQRTYLRILNEAEEIISKQSAALENTVVAFNRILRFRGPPPGVS